MFILILVMVKGAAFAASMPTPTTPNVLSNTPMNRLTIRLRQQNIQIQREVKAGKLTKAQGKTLKGQVDAIRKQESADLKINGTKTLTDAQIASLNGQLDTLSKSIPIK
jgi:type IV pilus biogenesis protein CpaD/CtpE